MTSTVPDAALIGLMLLLTVNHNIADIMMQNPSLTTDEEKKAGWAPQLLPH